MLNPIKKQARAAGLLYLLVLITAIPGLVYVPGADFLAVFDKRQLDALAMLFVRLHGQGINVVSIFWGLWLFPFGMLVIRSGFLPRVLGVLLLIAGLGYVSSSFTALLLPQYADSVESLAGILECGEMPIIFWLLIVGARVPASDAATSQSEMAKQTG